jgi:hypothetical protein
MVLGDWSMINTATRKIARTSSLRSKSSSRDRPDTRASVDAKHKEAERLCSDKKDIEAQA